MASEPAKPPGEKNYGFVINNRACIGCHACSTACKSENEVPLGVYRTWVKYTETGVFPQSRRQFQVTRCNHCANPPCVRICPVTAMYQRADGIVEFDPDVCIGCKACMQACPYDAIYIDPNHGTAAKCHFCSHRTEVGLEPSCVVVCPVHAIIAGDMNDPDSEISRVLSKEQVTVRKPEQGTAPKLFYIEGNDVSMHPTAAARTPETFLWADVIPLHGDHASLGAGGHGVASASSSGGFVKMSASGTPLRAPQGQGMPNAGPIQVGQGRMAEHMVQTTYNAQHKVPWHWPVPAYLVTKGIGAGVFLALAAAWLFGLFAFDSTVALVGGVVSQIGMILTTILLVIDLERPERFLRILLRPQWKSWLARGAVLLIGFSTVSGIWLGVEAAAWMEWIGADVAMMARPWLLGVGSLFAIGAAIYTAFLFGQAEGRDLWQSPLLPFHLLVQALMMGGAGLAVMTPFVDAPEGMGTYASLLFGAMLVLDLFVTLLGEFGMPHASEVAAQAAHEISHGRYKNHFWWGSVVVGHVIPLALLVAGMPMLSAAAGVLAVVGLYFFEHAFVMAPQEIPNS